MKRLLLALLLLVACTPAPTPTAVSPNHPSNSDAQTDFYTIEITKHDQLLQRIDGVTGQKQTLFAAPLNGWLGSFDLLPSADGPAQFVLAYAPPPPEGQINFGFTGLYLLHSDEQTPRPLLLPDEDALYFDPVWSPDGQYIYFSHVEPLDRTAYTFGTTLKRLHLASGEVELIAEEGIWPQLSPDGRWLTYILSKPPNATNALMVANPDGSQARELVADNLFTAVDVPIFSPDNQYIYFTAAPLTSEPFLSWFDRLLGVQVASAHTLPSDWYRIPLAGGEIEQLTALNGISMYGRFAPDNQPLFAFSSQGGLYTMSVDGENVQKIQDGVFTDSFAWVRR